jgi:type VI secretion system protein
MVRRLLILGALLVGSGCYANERLLLKADLSARTNQNYAVSVEIVFVYGDDLLKEMLKLPAREWFRRREALKRDYPGATGFSSFLWEWVPGKRTITQKLRFKRAPKGVVLFANYITPGDHRVRVEPGRAIALHLSEAGFTVTYPE